MNIKKIYCFGTSYTAGGGFEFQDLHGKDIHHVYGNTNERLTQFNFSYPGQLQKILRENGHGVDVINLAKSGFGNERIYRKIWDVVTHPTFNKDETLFIIEWSDVGRREFFYNDLNDFIITNYDYNHGDYGHFHGLSYKWNSKTFQSINKELEKNSDIFQDFINKTSNVVEQIKLSVRNTHNAMGFLEYNGVKMIHTQPTSCWGLPDVIQEGYSKYQLFEEAFYGILQWSEDNKKSISKETMNLYQDYHIGLVGNKQVARLIFNKMIDMEYIDDDMVETWTKELFDLEEVIKSQIDNIKYGV